MTPLDFTDRRTLAPEQFEGLLSPLAAHYGVGMPTPQQDLEVVEWRISLPSECGQAWLEAPVEGAPGFLDSVRAVSTSMQRAIRLWLPYFWFSNLRTFRDYKLSAQLLVYSVCRAYRPKSRFAYSFDLLDHRTYPAILLSARRHLPQAQRRIQRMLLMSGHPTWAEMYKPKAAYKILETVARCHTLLDDLLDNERVIIEEAVSQFGGMQHPIRLQTSERETVRRYRRLFAGRDHTALRPLVELEATAALASALNRHGERKGSLELRRTAHEENFRKKSANFPGLNPLNTM